VPSRASTATMTMLINLRNRGAVGRTTGFGWNKAPLSHVHVYPVLQRIPLTGMGDGAAMGGGELPRGPKERKQLAPCGSSLL